MKEDQPEIDITTMSQLVEAARAGDTAAHSEICRQVQGRLNNMAGRHLDRQLRGKLNPSDIVQETLTRMVQGFGDFRGSSSAEFYAWLNTILKNQISSTRRGFHTQRRDVRREAAHDLHDDVGAFPLDQESPESQLQSREKLARFRAVIDRLAPDQARVIQLRGIDELPFEDIAIQMNRSVNAISKLWARALISLQQELSKLDDSLS